MAETCTVTMNGSSDEFATEAKLVKLVGSWVEAEEAALLQDSVMGTAVVMMSTAVAVIVVAAYLRNTMLSKGEKAVLYSLQWVFPLQSTQFPADQKSRFTLNPPVTQATLIEDKRDRDESPGHADEAEDCSEDEKKKSKRAKKMKSVLARRAKALRKKKIVHKFESEPVVSSESEADVQVPEVPEAEVQVPDVPAEEIPEVLEAEAEEVLVQEEVPEVPEVLEIPEVPEKAEQEDLGVCEEDIACEDESTKSCLVARSGCARRSQSAPSVVFAEPLTEDCEEETRPLSVPVPAARIPTPKEEVQTVRLVLGQEPFEVEVDVRECDLNLSAPTLSFLRCKGFITWCRDDIKGDCQWGNRCRYAHVAEDELRNYLMSILPPIPAPMCPQDFHCNQLNDLYHQAQYRHTCRIPNCPNAQEMWHAIPFHHPPAMPRSMPLSCYSYGAPFDMSLNMYGGPVIEPVIEPVGECMEAQEPYSYGPDY